jgi:outer membrane protein W
MLQRCKIFYLSIGILFLLTSALCVQGKNKTKHAHPKNKVTIGFQTGKEYSFGNTSIRQGKLQQYNKTGIVLRKPLSNHFKAEAGISYATPPSQCCVSNIYGTNQKIGSTLTLPATIQYYMLPKCCKLQPYIGTGLQYNFNGKNIVSPFTGEGSKIPAGSAADTKYISIVFTQGVTFEINTRIQITQSFDFVPAADKTIGIDLGIGYTLP